MEGIKSNKYFTVFSPLLISGQKDFPINSYVYNSSLVDPKIIYLRDIVVEEDDNHTRQAYVIDQDLFLQPIEIKREEKSWESVYVCCTSPTGKPMKTLIGHVNPNTNNIHLKQSLRVYFSEEYPNRRDKRYVNELYDYDYNNYYNSMSLTYYTRELLGTPYEDWRQWA